MAVFGQITSILAHVRSIMRGIFVVAVAKVFPHVTAISAQIAPVSMNTTPVLSAVYAVVAQIAAVVPGVLP